MEVETKEQYNPIKQDTNKNKQTGEKQLREYGVKPFFNYGCLPQTWENDRMKDRATKCYGDNDPLDIVDLGESKLEIGTFTQVKLLGALCLLD